MKKYLIHITAYFSLIILIFIIFFYLVEKGLKSSNYLNLAEWNEIYNSKIKADIVINGSSRAYKQIDPNIIDSITNINTYNLGIEGYHIPMQLTKYIIYKQHNSTPKNIIHIVDHFSLNKRKDLYNVEQFLPYLSDTTLTHQLKKYAGLKWSDYYLPCVKYIGKSNYIMAGLLTYFNLKTFNNPTYKGYNPNLKSQWENEFDQTLNDNPEGKKAIVIPHVIKQFNNYVKNESKHSNIFIVYAPEYYEFQTYIKNRNYIAKIYQTIANQYNNVYFIDYKDHSICKKKIYFYNPTHLNKKGAELFSEDLAKQLLPLLK
jgi:hypothetical protein